jgi:hypothetical protein
MFVMAGDNTNRKCIYYSWKQQAALDTLCLGWLYRDMEMQPVQSSDFFLG